MTWLISQALLKGYENSRYSQGPAGESSGGTCSDGEQFAQLNVMPTPHPFWRNDKTIDTSSPFLFGLTCAHLTADLGEDVLMWCQEAFRVRTSVLQERVLDSTERAADCGQSLRGSLARYDPATHSLKTAQHSLIEDSTGCSVTLPRSGSMRNGECYQQPTLALRTSGKGCGLLPTPTICGNYNRKGASKTSGDGLATYVKKYPTPCASDNRNRGGPNTPAIARRIEKGKQVMLSMTVDGQMNPTFPEWLMGWPIGWTELKPLATDKFREWQQQHSPR